jgi:hypothetical protein
VDKLSKVHDVSSHLRQMVEPKPPVNMIKQAEHHWLDSYDSDGHFFGTYVLQWAPGVNRWCHSGNVGTGMYVNTYYWSYNSHCKMPDM